MNQYRCWNVSGDVNPPRKTQPMAGRMTNRQMVRAVLTDIQFWIPAVVLALGIALLVALH